MYQSINSLSLSLSIPLFQQRGTRRVPPEITRTSQASDERDDVGGGAAIGWRPDLQEVVDPAGRWVEGNGTGKC